MSRLNIGIVGSGYMGSLHAGILQKDERARLTAVYDVAAERAQACARSLDARAMECLEDLLDSSDAIFITTPNTRHVDVALQALAAGRHVFCEKPLATSLDEARQVLEASYAARGLLQVGHNRRFAPVYQTVKSLLEGSEKKTHSVHAKMNRGELLNPSWVGDRGATGGFLYETTIHMLDLLRWLFGEVESVMVHASSHEYPEPDDFSILLKFSNGVHASLASSADASWHFPFERLEIFAHHATIETMEMERLTYTTELEQSPSLRSFEELEKESRWGYVQEDMAFLDAVLNGWPPRVTVQDGYKAVALVEACYRSARTGQIITPNQYTDQHGHA